MPFSQSLLCLLLWCTSSVIFAQTQPRVTLSRLSSPPLSSVRKITKKSIPDEVDILPPQYYRDIAPVVNGEPVHVKVSVIILSMKVSTGSEQSFDVDIFYHNYWSDYRLRKPTNEAAIQHLPSLEHLPVFRLHNSWRNRLWIPDTYFRNAIRGSVSNILTPTHYFNVKNYTNLFMAVRVSLKLSSSEDNSTLVLDWHTFRVGSHVDVTEFTIVSVDRQECTKKLDIGYYSCLYGEVVFKRNMGNYLIKRLIPSFIIVVMSMLGFWIPTQISPTRTILPITALLALITQQIQSNLNVSYVYALQVWNIVCIAFVFFNLLEYAIALYVMHMAHKRKAQKAARNAEVKTQPEKEQSSKAKLWRRIRGHFRTTSRSSAVDKISRYLFPLSFGLFIAVFTIYCVLD